VPCLRTGIYRQAAGSPWGPLHWADIIARCASLHHQEPPFCVGSLMDHLLGGVGGDALQNMVGCSSQLPCFFCSIARTSACASTPKACALSACGKMAGLRAVSMFVLRWQVACCK
jgi:hypothetical protein